MITIVCGCFVAILTPSLENIPGWIAEVLSKSAEVAVLHPNEGAPSPLSFPDMSGTQLMATQDGTSPVLEKSASAASFTKQEISAVAAASAVPSRVGGVSDSTSGFAATTIGSVVGLSLRVPTLQETLMTSDQLAAAVARQNVIPGGETIGLGNLSAAQETPAGAMRSKLEPLTLSSVSTNSLPGMGTLASAGIEPKAALGLGREPASVNRLGITATVPSFESIQTTPDLSDTQILATAKKLGLATAGNGITDVNTATLQSFASIQPTPDFSSPQILATAEKTRIGTTGSGITSLSIPTVPSFESMQATPGLSGTQLLPTAASK